MKLQMMTLYATAERTIQPGEVADFAPEEARALIAGHYAMSVDPAPAPETKGRKQARKATPATAKNPTPPDPDGGADSTGTPDDDGAPPEE